jgi:hypothetical protein
MRSQARRSAPTFWLGWALALIGAAIVAGAFVLALSVLFSLLPYIPSSLR